MKPETRACCSHRTCFQSSLAFPSATSSPWTLFVSAYFSISTTKTTFSFCWRIPVYGNHQVIPVPLIVLILQRSFQFFPAHCSGFPLVTFIPVYLLCYLIFYIKLRSHQHSLSVEAASSTPSLQAPSPPCWTAKCWVVLGEHFLPLIPVLTMCYSIYFSYFMLVLLTIFLLVSWKLVYLFSTSHSTHILLLVLC